MRVEKRWVSPKGRCPKTSPAVEQSHDPNTAHDDRALVEPVTDGLVVLTDQAISAGLPPVPLPEARASKRVFARLGFLTEAEPVFTADAGLPRLGSLLILSALEATGLVDAAKDVYRQLANADSTGSLLRFSPRCS